MRNFIVTLAVAFVATTTLFAQGKGSEAMITVSAVQTDKDNGYNGNPNVRCGIKFNFRLSGITKIEVESVDGNPLAGKASIQEDGQGKLIADGIKMQVPLSRSQQPISPASFLEKIITFPPCLVTFTGATGFPSTATDLWLIISVYTRWWNREHS